MSWSGSHERADMGGTLAEQGITIVGAGLSGLTAAINLARDGREVTVLEKEKRRGGRPEFRPDGAASPFDAREACFDRMFGRESIHRESWRYSDGQR